MTHALNIFKKTESPSEGGFTLIELLVTMLIMSILMSIAVPSLVSWREQGADSETRSTVAKLASKAQTLAKPGDFRTVNLEVVKASDLRLLPGTIIGMTTSTTGMCITAYRDGSGSYTATKPLIYDSGHRDRFLESQDQVGSGECAASIWGTPILPAYKVTSTGDLVAMEIPATASSVCNGVQPKTMSNRFTATSTAGQQVELEGFIQLTPSCRELKYELRVMNVPDADLKKQYTLNLATSNLVQNGTTYSTGTAQQVAITGTKTTAGSMPTGWTETSNWAALRIDSPINESGFLQYTPIIWKKPTL